MTISKSIKEKKAAPKAAAKTEAPKAAAKTEAPKAAPKPAPAECPDPRCAELEAEIAELKSKVAVLEGRIAKIIEVLPVSKFRKSRL